VYSSVSKCISLKQKFLSSLCPSHTKLLSTSVYKLLWQAHYKNGHMCMQQSMFISWQILINNSKYWLWIYISSVESLRYMLDFSKCFIFTANCLIKYLNIDNGHFMPLLYRTFIQTACYMVIKCSYKY